MHSPSNTTFLITICYIFRKLIYSKQLQTFFITDVAISTVHTPLSIQIQSANETILKLSD